MTPDAPQNGSQPQPSGNGAGTAANGTSNAANGSGRPRFSQDHIRFMESMATNAMLMRQQWFQQAFDDRRDVDRECGYPPSSVGLSADFFRELYEREPIAARVVELMPKETWQVTPLVYETEDADRATEFEQAWDQLGQDLRGEMCWYGDEEGSPVWDHLKRVDILSGIGHFGVLLLGIDDGRNLMDPIEGFVTNRDRRAVPVTNARGERVGWTTRYKGHAQPVMPDSFMTEAEEASIRNPRRVRVLQDPKGYSRTLQPGPVLNALEEQAVRQWADQRQATLNVAKSPGAPGSPPHRPSTGGVSQHAGGLALGAPRPNKDGPASMYNDPGGGGTTLRGQPLGQVYGTDLQYDAGAGMGMPAPQAFVAGESAGYSPNGPAFGVPKGDFSGTDQQYFGVQFGPSEQPPEEPSKQRRRLLFIRAFDESLVQIVRYEWNIRNPRFGMPVMYRVTLNDPREQHSGVGLPLATVFVHWSRLIHVADNLRSSEIFGVPRQRHVLNRLLDLRKIYGSGAEAFWKQSQMKLLLSTHPQLGPDVDVDVAGMRNDVENFSNSLQQYLFLQGMSGQTVAPSVVDPTGHVNVQLQAICIYLGCPMRVFMGSERGELASSQDDSAWNDRLRERQTNYLTPRVIIPFIDRLIALGILPEPEGYSVEWPDLDSLGDKDKAAIALQLTQALGAYVSGQCESVMPPLSFFTEILGWDEEKTQAMLDAAAKVHESQDTMTMPPQIAGQPAKPAPGTAADAQQKQAAAKAKAMADAAAKQANAPKPPIKLNPGQTLVHPDSVGTPRVSVQPPTAGTPKPPSNTPPPA